MSGIDSGDAFDISGDFSADDYGSGDWDMGGDSRCSGSGGK